MIINNLDEYRTKFQAFMDIQNEINRLKNKLITLKRESEQLERAIAEYKKSKRKQ